MNFIYEFMFTGTQTPKLATENRKRATAKLQRQHPQKIQNCRSKYVGCIARGLKEHEKRQKEHARQNQNLMIPVVVVPVLIMYEYNIDHTYIHT